MKKLFLVLSLTFSTPILNVAHSSNEKTIMQNDSITTEFLQSFADAFNAHDTKLIMSFMTEDCVFEASSGEEVDGQKFTGQEEVRKAFENVFKTFPDAHWGNANHVVSGERGFSEWIFTGTKPDGSKVEVTGCDLFTFRNSKIAIKNSYRKNRVGVGLGRHSQDITETRT
jgi:ketosteroid isomerase-like protein